MNYSDEDIKQFGGKAVELCSSISGQDNGIYWFIGKWYYVDQYEYLFTDQKWLHTCPLSNIQSIKSSSSLPNIGYLESIQKFKDNLPSNTEIFPQHISTIRDKRQWKLMRQDN